MLRWCVGALSLGLAAVPAAAQLVPAAALNAALTASDRPAGDLRLDQSRKPAEVLAFVGLKPGDHAIDLLSGTGYYAELMARIVGPSGSVIAQSPPTMATQLAPRLAERQARLPNIQPVSSQFADLRLEPDSLDVALWHLSYHDVYFTGGMYQFARAEPDAVLKALFAAMKSGGVVAIIDHVADPGGDPRVVAAKLHRIDPALIRADFARAGFRFDRSSPLLRDPSDDHRQNVFEDAIRGRTDRVVYRFVKP